MSHDQPTQVIYYPDAPHQEAPPPPRRAGCGCLMPLLVLLTLVLAVVAAALLLTPTRETLLVLGSDARPDEIRRGEPGRTDTLLLVVADRATPKFGMVSVPRDLWVPIPGYGEERINTAFSAGGASVAKRTVEGTLGVPVDRYIVIGLQGVRDVVDAVGGVDITVDEAIYDPAYPTDDYGTVEVRIPAGLQHMDGETALRYARTRHQDSDFARAGRQQKVLSAVRNKLMNPLNWYRIPGVFFAVQTVSRTDLNPLDFVALSAAALRDFGEPDRLVLDTTYVEPYMGQGGAALLLPRSNLKQGVARFLGTSVPNVEVQNAAGVGGLARSVGDKLSQWGFTVVAVGDADRQVAQTMVLARPEARRAAETVASALGLPSGRVSESGSLPGGVDVRVLVGADLAR